MLARGLGLIRVVTNLLHSFDAAGNNLIIVVGADERENGWIGEGETRAIMAYQMELTCDSIGRTCCYQQIAEGSGP